MAADVTNPIDTLVESTASLLHTVAGLTDDAVRRPSLLPGWSRGHVLTHVARNADAMRNLAAWARTGEETPMYASREVRNAAIEIGAGRPAADLVADVRDTHERLLADLRDLTEEQWRRPIRWGYAGHESEAAEIPLLRRTEVEVHHVDVDLDHTVAHWPEDFVEYLLGQAAVEFSMRDDMAGFVLVGNDHEGRWTVGAGGQEISGPPPALLGWLLGRTDGTGLHSDAVLPEPGVWR